MGLQGVMSSDAVAGIHGTVRGGVGGGGVGGGAKGVKVNGTRRGGLGVSSSGAGGLHVGMPDMEPAVGERKHEERLRPRRRKYPGSGKDTLHRLYDMEM